MTLTVSNGPGDVSIPSVQGLSVAQATRELRHAGLRVGHNVPQSSTSFASGLVTATNPQAGRSVSPGTTVTLEVSSGQPQKPVPNVAGETQDQATAALTKAGFNVNPENQPSSTVAVGNVISQHPDGGVTAPAGSTVTIVVATAPATVTVPSVKGDPVSGAQSALTAAGFNVVQTTQSVKHASENGIVVSQSPGGNSTAKKGSTVTITVGQYTASSTTTSSTTKSSSSSTTTPTTSSSSSSTTPAP